MSLTFDVLEGDALAVMRKMPAGSQPCIVTDPPYAGFGLPTTPAGYMQKFAPFLSEIRRVGGFGGRMAISQPPGRIGIFREHLPPTKTVVLDNAFTDGRGEAAHFLVSNAVMAEPPEPQAWAQDVVPRSIHPNDRDITQMSVLIGMLSKPGQTVFDPFCGSAAIGVAALLMGRNYVGIELVPDRVKDAKTRLRAALKTQK